ncbi:3-dehydroquinate synthase [Sodalis sp. CWE]|uniref:3-dehydroquinate synthase n=1 Tax=Sodalis sp. CWE TaxID=2803816 RepID=UPI001C7D3054|nr:3-dehydroquinate synthase [Sodalis sp. CWE]
MEKVTVSLGTRSYPITIGFGLLKDPTAFWPLISGDSAILITNDRLTSLYLDPLYKRLVQVGIKVDCIILPDGEQNKSLLMLDRIFTFLLKRSYSREITIIALGGGVIGDLAGFAAASYKRGVRLIHAPTTLLSQVDSSIGGKTAINHSLGKNMIGVFYQPVSVIIDLDCLDTLPRREFSSGLAEIIKYGIAFDASFFYWLENNLELIFKLEPKALAYCVCHCCKLKSKVITNDEYEKSQRILLNLGHTYGHAIEVHTGYDGNWLHGEAVSAGIMMAAFASYRLGQFNDFEAKRVSTLLIRAGLPISGPINMKPNDYLPYMMRDKKVKSGQLHLVLPTEIGSAKVYANVTNDVAMASIKDCQNLVN